MCQIVTKVTLIILSIISVCLLCFSLILAFVILPLVVDSQIDKNIQLVQGTYQWNVFKQLPFNLSLSITLFEVTNAYGVIDYGEDPRLKERGPYVFDEIRKKVNIKYNDDNDTISYQRELKFHFNQSRSGPNVNYDENITILNPVYLAVMQMAGEVKAPISSKAKAAFIMNCLDATFDQKLVLTISIRKLLFDGFKICDFNNFSCSILGFFSICSDFLGKSKQIEEVKEHKEHYLKFSLMNYKQREPDGIYEIKTGVSDINEVGSIVKWNDKSITDFWVQGRLKKNCDLIRGTDGSIFPPHATEETVLRVYSTDICRYVEAFFVGIDTYRDKEGYIYRTLPSIFHSSTKSPSEDCFCIEKTLDVDGEKSCFLDGVLDLFSCVGVPALVSYPHFLYADPKYSMNLKGDMSPDKEKHSIYMMLDKYSGIPLKVHIRVQVNMICRPIEDFEKLTSSLPRTILPLLWLDEGIELPDTGIELLNTMVYDRLYVMNVVKWTLIGITLGLTLLSCGLLCSQTCWEKGDIDE